MPWKVVAVAPFVPTSALHPPTRVLAFEPRSPLNGGGDGLKVVAEVVGARLRWTTWVTGCSLKSVALAPTAPYASSR